VVYYLNFLCNTLAMTDWTKHWKTFLKYFYLMRMLSKPDGRFGDRVTLHEAEDEEGMG